MVEGGFLERIADEARATLMASARPRVLRPAAGSSRPTTKIGLESSSKVWPASFPSYPTVDESHIDTSG